jgi:hypothetical protein
MVLQVEVPEVVVEELVRGMELLLHVIVRDVMVEA